MNYQEINKRLSNRKNWTEELVYVHRTRLLLGFLVGFFIGLFISTLIFWHKSGVAERYIKNVNENCIVVRKIDPIGDLQRFFNKQNNEQYDCGEPDSIPGPKFREVAKKWVCNQYYEKSVARMPKENE